MQMCIGGWRTLRYSRDERRVFALPACGPVAKFLKAERDTLQTSARQAQPVLSPLAGGRWSGGYWRRHFGRALPPRVGAGTPLPTLPRKGGRGRKTPAVGGFMPARQAADYAIGPEASGKRQSCA